MDRSSCRAGALIAGVASLVALLAPASAPAYELTRTVFSNSAVATEKGSYTLLATLGDYGAAAGVGDGTFFMTTGFWAGYTPNKLVAVHPPAVERHFDTALQLAMPNPFTDRTLLSYSVAREASVRLTIYGVNGRVIRTLVRDFQAPGSYRVDWDGTDDHGRKVPTSIYFYKLEVGDWSTTRKLTRLR